MKFEYDKRQIQRIASDHSYTVWKKEKMNLLIGFSKGISIRNYCLMKQHLPG